MAANFDWAVYKQKFQEAMDARNRAMGSWGMSSSPVAGRPGYPVAQPTPGGGALPQVATAAAIQNLTGGGDAAAAALETGGVTPWLSGAGLGGLGEGGALAPGVLDTGGVTPWMNYGGFSGVGEGGVLTNGATPGIGAMPYAGAAGAALGAYGLYNALKNHNAKSGALSGAALGGGLAAAAPLVGLGPVGWGGLALAAALGGAGGFGITKIFGHKGTKDYIKERTNNLMQQDWGSSRDLVAGLRDRSDDDNALWAQMMSDPAKKKEVLSDPIGNWGQLGMLKTFGSDYFNKMNEAQRYAATKYAIDNNLFKDDHGDRIITDENKLRGALNEFSANKDYLNAYNAWKSGGGGPSALLSPPPATANRSKTKSPGISKDGKRISY